MALYKYKDTWYCRFQVNGREIRRSTGHTSKKAAAQFERELRAELKGSRVRPRTYGDALIRWFETGAPESARSPANNTRSHLETCLLTDLPDRVPDMVADMLSSGLSSMTINRRLAAVRRVLNLAYKRWGWIDQPLADRVQLLSERGTERHIYLSRQEVTSLVDAMTDPVARSVTLLAAFTGLRRGEILGLQPHHWRAPNIVLTHTKSGRPRIVPLIEELHPAMAMLPFPITGHELRKAFESARKMIGREDIRFHDLRHTYASWLASDPTIPMAMLRDVLGHSSLAVTSRYAHLRGDGLEIIRGALSDKNRTKH